jgi:glutathionylspermidine synthase
MNYNFNGKNITIPNADIEKSMSVLNISKDEAIQLWLEDEGYLENEVVEELTEKAKVNKINHEAKASKPRKSVKRERKPDEEKENLIEILANCLKNAGFDTEIVNKSKLIEFNVGENHYKLDLIKQRPPKK